MWAGQGLSADGRAWAHAGAVAVACPALSRLNRLVVRGPHAATVSLVEAVVPMLASSYVLFGDADLISAVTTAVTWLAPRNEFGWMDAVSMPFGGRSRQVRWLSTREWPEVTDLLGRVFPDSHAWPAEAGVRAWAGIRDGSGSLVATAADAWSAPAAGFLAGVAVSESARGQGYGQDACRFVLKDLIAAHGRASLMVRTWNEPAIRIYRGLGMSWRLLGSAWIRREHAR